MKKIVLVYGILGGVLIAALNLIEYRFLVLEHSLEIYGGLVAAVFSGVGIWLGLKLTRTRETVVVREVPVPFEVRVPVHVSGPFVRNEKKLQQLGITALGRRRTIPSPPPRFRGHMKRVTGIGGIFFKAKDAPSLQAWYKQHLGIDVQVWGGASFDWTDTEGKPVAGTTAWLIAPQESKQFAPSSAPFMVNYRVDDVHALVEALKEEGCNVLEKIDESEYGKFAWVVDPEGNKVELWQPPQGQ